MGRAKHVLSKLGFDVSGVVDLAPQDLEGRCALVRIEFQEHQDPVTGIRAVRPTVPFLGYERTEEPARAPWDD